MMPCDPTSFDRERIAYLATLYVTGDLSDAEADEFLAILQTGEGEAATVAWESLEMAHSLRIAIGSRFLDSTRERLRRAQQYTRRSSASNRFALLGMFFVCVGLLYVSRLVFAPVGDSAPVESPVISLQRASGIITIEGCPVTGRSGLPLDKTVSLEAGAHVRMRWALGHTVDVSGPAELILHRTGLAVRRGSLEVTAVDAFELLLPDGSVVAQPGARLVIGVRAGAGVVGVLDGTASYQALGRETPYLLQQGVAVDQVGHVYQWESRVLPSRLQEYSFDKAATTWRVRGTLLLGVEEGILEFHKQPEDASDTVMCVVRVMPDEVQIHSGGIVERMALQGEALLPREFVLSSWAGGAPVLVIEGHTVPVVLPADFSLAVMRVTGEARVSNATYSTGPLGAPVRK